MDSNIEVQIDISMLWGAPLRLVWNSIPRSPKLRFLFDSEQKVQLFENNFAPPELVVNLANNNYEGVPGQWYSILDIDIYLQSDADPAAMVEFITSTHRLFFNDIVNSGYQFGANENWRGYFAKAFRYSTDELAQADALGFFDSKILGSLQSNWHSPDRIDLSIIKVVLDQSLGAHKPVRTVRYSEYFENWKQTNPTLLDAKQFLARLEMQGANLKAPFIEPSDKKLVDPWQNSRD